MNIWLILIAIGMMLAIMAFAIVLFDYLWKVFRAISRLFGKDIPTMAEWLQLRREIQKSQKYIKQNRIEEKLLDVIQPLPDPLPIIDRHFSLCIYFHEYDDDSDHHYWACKKKKIFSVAGPWVKADGGGNKKLCKGCVDYQIVGSSHMGQRFSTKQLDSTIEKLECDIAAMRENIERLDNKLALLSIWKRFGKQGNFLIEKIANMNHELGELQKIQKELLTLKEKATLN